MFVSSRVFFFDDCVGSMVLAGVSLSVSRPKNEIKLITAMKARSNPFSMLFGNSAVSVHLFLAYLERRFCQLHALISAW